jgi:hypothetical protein
MKGTRTMKTELMLKMLSRPGIHRWLVVLVLWISFGQVTAIAEEKTDNSAQPAKTYVSFSPIAWI